MKIVSLSLLLMAAFTGLDYALGEKVSLLPLQWLPVAVAAWYGGFYEGLALAFIGVGAAGLLHHFEDPSYWEPLRLWSSLLMRLFSNLFAAWLLHALRETNRKESDLRREAQQKERLLKASMLELMSHEINSALTVLETGVHLMKDRREPGADGWHALEKTLARMQSASRDFIARTRMNEGRIADSIERVDPAAAILLAVDAFQPLLEERGQKAIVENLAPGRKVWADRAALSLILASLISNAVKYGPPNGRIEIRVEPGEEPGRLFVSVSDEGKALDLVRCQKGPGIAAMQELLRLHNSALDVSKTPGGSRFTFFLTEASELT